MQRIALIFAVALAGAVYMPPVAQAHFGLAEFDVSFTDEADSPAMQAGSHPFAFTTSFKANESEGEPDGRLRDLFLEEMPGLLINTFPVPQCSAADFETLVEGRNDCFDSTAVGIFRGASGSPGNWATAPVFSLVPPPGVLMRLGFRVAGTANVIVDLELSPEPPYRLLASIGEVPESIELFAGELQLWGVPSDPSHDESRGACAVLVGSCPTSNPREQFLTLPTSCEGPQETFYEAIAWGGGEAVGAALTHDGAGEPLGVGGCGRLAFDPRAIAKPTTEAAQSPTGLELSIEAFDEGLIDPDGVAQSQIRELVVALPAGMEPGPALRSAAGSCSEADVEAEALDEDLGDGCPLSSVVGTVKVESPLLVVGTVKVESPLLEGRLIQGSVFRATPDANFAGDAETALYVVLKNAGFGVSVVQPVALEVEAGTGELIAFAGEMPQLPFSRLSLHLDDGAGGPLVSAPRCGQYESEVDLYPWSGEGGIGTSSTFQIVSGPNGGPCPTGTPGNGAGAGSAANQPPGAGGPVPSRRRAGHRRRCGKGRHRVHRHGGTRCVKARRGRHRGHPRHSR